MPIHGPRGDPHKTGGGGSGGFGGETVSPFGSFMDLLLPAIGSALNQVAFHGETLQGVARDYFSPVFGPGAPERYLRDIGRGVGTRLNQAGAQLSNFIADDFSLIGRPNELLLRDAGKQARSGVNFLVNSVNEAVNFGRDPLNNIGFKPPLNRRRFRKAPQIGRNFEADQSQRGRGAGVVR